MSTTGGTGIERELDPAHGQIPTDTFAARLILARHHAGQLSQREAAERCGLNYASWSNWENSMRPRDILDVVERIADGLNIDRDWLLFGGPLGQSEARSLRRTMRRGEEVGQPVSRRYRSITGRATPNVMTINSRPNGRRDTTRPDTPRRTARLPRGAAPMIG